MRGKAKEYVDGSELIARAAIRAGCDFFAGYPITPASGILIRMMRELPKYGGIAIQAEDEIASMGMCIAAAMAGKRPMTATSGPGMSLYSENIGLAIMGEVPVVIVNVQRLGPATGGATTGAEGDTQFVQWITSGGLPLIVLAPVDGPTTYWLTTLAFKLAERFRHPVILNTAKDLVQAMETVEQGSLREEEVTPRPYFRGGERFLPYKFDSLDQIPEFLPIGADLQVRFTTSMHDEYGIITKKPEKVDKTFRHFYHKIMDHVDELEFTSLDAQEGSRTLIIASGLSARISRAAVRQARKLGKKVSLLILYTIWPVPEQAIKNAAENAEKIIVPEMNLGLYRREIERILPNKQVIGVNRVDGNPVSVDQILQEGGIL